MYKYYFLQYSLLEYHFPQSKFYNNSKNILSFQLFLNLKEIFPPKIIMKLSLERLEMKVIVYMNYCKICHRCSLIFMAFIRELQVFIMMQVSYKDI